MGILAPRAQGAPLVREATLWAVLIIAAIAIAAALT